ncbi:MAG TPA: type II toxin-antitoxin system PrlF family antitoxin [Solimonas sp.]|nr:type II toxin-antitoxin system PrlF family antitoxin [Solimonas sp.]
MSTHASRLTTKYQATIPASVRKALGLKAGDAVAFEVKEPGIVQLRKQQAFDAQYAKALAGTLESEWLSDADEAAYGDL